MSEETQMKEDKIEANEPYIIDRDPSSRELIVCGFDSHGNHVEVKLSLVED